MNNYIYDSDIIEVFPHLYISNWYTSNNILELKKHNIKSVITVETREKPKEIIDEYKNNNIDFKYLFSYDIPSFPIDIYFEESYEFIDKHIKNGDNVLVHCYAGISRSTTIILNYIIRKFYEYNNNIKCPCYVLNYCLNIVKTKRDIINPNTGFTNQLLEKSKQYYKNKFSLK